jgi:hypothetical protein
VGASARAVVVLFLVPELMGVIHQNLKGQNLKGQNLKLKRAKLKSLVF